MRPPQHQIASTLLRLMLRLALAGAFMAAVYARFYSGWIRVEDLPSWPAYVAYFALSAAVWLSLEPGYRLAERFFAERSTIRWLWRVIKLDLVTLALVSSVVFFWRGYSFSRYTVAIFWTTHLVFCWLGAMFLRKWLRRSQAQDAAWIILVGEPASFDPSLERYLSTENASRVSWSGDVPAALEELRASESVSSYVEVLVVLPLSEATRAPLLADALRRLPIPGSIAIAGPAAAEGDHGQTLLWFSSDRSPAGEFDYVVLKRLVDLSVSGLALLMLAPALAIIAIITLARTGRPVWISQDRVGRCGRRFRLYKFRTLPVTSLTNSDWQWIPPRTDSWGHFLRSTGIDELLQLWNVIRGEMSLVGPRPERPHFVEQFRRQLPFYSTRHRLQVGITGWAQVHGWRGDTSIPARVEHDLYYLRHWSLSLDLRILAMTAANVFRNLREWRAAPRGSEHAGPA